MFTYAMEYQRKAIDEIHRVLRPGGKFRIIELMYSKDPKKRWYQGDLTSSNLTLINSYCPHLV